MLTSRQNVLTSAPDHLSFPVFARESEVSEVIAALAQKLSQKFRNQPVSLVVNFDGAIYFARDLIQDLNFFRLADEPPLETADVKLTSYRGTESTGHINVIKPLRASLVGRHVIIVEDIVDTGLIATCLVEMVLEQNPQSVTLATLVDKPYCHDQIFQFKGWPDGYFEFLSCFIYPGHKFLIGKGLDFDGHFRELREIRLMPRPRKKNKVAAAATV